MNSDTDVLSSRGGHLISDQGTHERDWSSIARLGKLGPSVVSAVADIWGLSAGTDCFVVEGEGGQVGTFRGRMNDCAGKPLNRRQSY